MLDISLRPRTCSCPNATYTCEVNDATGINWKTNTTGDSDVFLYTVSSDTKHRNDDGFRVRFTFEEAGEFVYNFTSTLEVTDLDQNETNLTYIRYRGTT